MVPLPSAVRASEPGDRVKACAPTATSGRTRLVNQLITWDRVIFSISPLFSNLTRKIRLRGDELNVRT
jgi:hypothetical protein